MCQIHYNNYHYNDYDTNVSRNNFISFLTIHLAINHALNTILDMKSSVIKFEAASSEDWTTHSIIDFSRRTVQLATELHSSNVGSSEFSTFGTLMSPRPDRRVTDDGV